MSLFSQLKQIKDLKEQAKTLQEELAKEVITAEKGGIKITMNGSQEVLNVEIINENILGNKNS